MINNPKKPNEPQNTPRENARNAVRALLHEFYIEMATTKMSKDKFEEYLDRFIEVASSAENE